MKKRLRVPHETEAMRLSDAPAGARVRLHRSNVDAQSREQLRALGLTDTSAIRVCQQGEPCVVQVRATRIGMSARIAEHLMVIACDEEASWR